MTLALFVYGTLRAGLPAAFVSRQATASRRLLHERGVLEGQGVLPGRLVAVSWYPGLVPGGSGEQVRGEVWRLPGAATLARLDAYEGRDYTRRIRRIRLDSGRLLMAHVYLYVRDVSGLPVIPTGDFADWLAKPRDPRDDRTS